MEHKLDNNIKKSVIEGLYTKFGNPTKVINVDNSSLLAILIFEKTKDIVIVTQDKNLRIKFDTVLTYNVSDNSKVSTNSYSSLATSTTKTNTGSMIGRSIAGGIIAGGAGAVIGGTTAPKTTITDFGGSFSTSTTTHDYNVIININSISTPTITLNFKEDETAYNSFIAILNVILNSYTNKIKAEGENAISSIGESYANIEAKKKKLELEEKAKKRKEKAKEEEEELEDKETKYDLISNKPISILSEFLAPVDIIAMLSIPLGYIVFYYTWENHWWMFFSLLALDVILLFTLMPIIGMYQKYKKEKMAFHLGVVSVSGIYNILLVILPLILSFSGGCKFLYRITGQYWHEYDGGLIVTLLSLASVIALFCVVPICISSLPENAFGSKRQSDLNKRTFKWGCLTAIIINFIMIATYIGVCNDWNGVKKVERQNDPIYQIPYESKPTEVYHNKEDGSVQYQYQNSSEQEQDLKDIDNIIEEEKKNGVYDENPY